jgi:photoactive yellow protein
MSSDETARAGSACVLCDRPLARAERGGPPVGFCPACAAELGMVHAEDLLELSPDAVDRLPFGFIGIDADGAVTSFNAFEERLSGLSRPDVVGRSFFREVAPCTAVREFEGRFREMVETGTSRLARFRYVFRFAGGERLVQITMTYFPQERRGLLIVRDLAAV